jgi:hypothetical protein
MKIDFSTQLDIAHLVEEIEPVLRRIIKDEFDRLTSKNLPRMAQEHLISWIPSKQLSISTYRQ